MPAMKGLVPRNPRATARPHIDRKDHKRPGSGRRSPGGIHCESTGAVGSLRGGIAPVVG